MTKDQDLLTNFGFTTRVACQIIVDAYNKGLTYSDIKAWIHEAQTSTSLRNPLGFVRARLQNGDKLDTRAPTGRHQLRHKPCKCGQLFAIAYICQTCGLCPYCCTCDPPEEHKESPMTNTPNTTSDKLDYAFLLIGRLPPALLARTANLGQITQELKTIQNRFCTGRTHWRDQNAPGKTPKLYVLHSTDESCPIHGTPPRGRRTRVYIGNKPDKIAKALDDIERTSHHTDLQRRLHHIERIIDHATHNLQAIYRNLDYTPPQPGDHTLTPRPTHVPIL